MWMNEMEVETAAERNAEHPVLGPATATLAALVEFTNANSDGWAYWPKPGRAAARLQEMIHAAGYRTTDPRYAEPTREAYKMALRPVKAFRTRWEHEHLGLSPAFVIHEPLGEHESAKVWRAEREYARAHELAEQALAQANTLRALAGRAYQALDVARDADRLEQVNRLVEKGVPSNMPEQLAELARYHAGDKVWRLPESRGHDKGFHGLGHAVTVTGLAYRMSGAVLTVVDSQGQHGHEYRPMSVARARELWWILDKDGENLVSGGHRSKSRMIALVGERYDGQGCRVVQGSDFIPEA